MKKNCHTCQHAWSRYDGPQCTLLGVEYEDVLVRQWRSSWSKGVLVQCPSYVDHCPGWQVNDFELKRAGKKALGL